ncbi:MAG TPA: nucleoside hydrolase [Verrucomicrobiae bacterium]
MKPLGAVLFMLVALTLSAATKPVIYCTDLFHPHVDPDDHFDLATLFALPELDVKAIVLDQGNRQLERPGSIPLKQMFSLAGHEVPYAIGLSEKLASPADDGRGQPAGFQHGVGLMLKTLREASQPVTIITAGSVRDLCAAWNREPELLREKVGRLYLNIGNAAADSSEYNVDLDPHAYVGILRSDLPIYLCLCMPMGRQSADSVYSTWWRFRQADVVGSVPEPLQRFFIYALQRCAPDELDPLKALESDLRPWRRLVWDMDRNMWCTASFLHAAGRKIYMTGQTWTAPLTRPPNGTSEALFTFFPARVEVDEAGKTKLLPGAANSNVQLLKVVSPDEYAPALRDCLRGLLQSGFPARAPAGGRSSAG